MIKVVDNLKQRSRISGEVYENPMLDVAELTTCPKCVGKEIGMGYSGKDSDYTQKWKGISGSQKNPTATAVDVGPAEYPPSLQGISATKLRNAIKNNNIAAVREMLPQQITPEEYMAIFK